jgi:hypothetical protein
MSAPLPSSQSVERVAETATPPGTPKVWKVGTLTYTGSGITALLLLLVWGDFALALRDRSVVEMAKWYLNSLDVPSWLFGLLITSFPGAVALFLGPIISMKSDRHRGKWGRRIPFLLVTTPIAAFGMIGIALTPIITKALQSTGSRLFKRPATISNEEVNSSMEQVENQDGTTVEYSDEYWNEQRKKLGMKPLH